MQKRFNLGTIQPAAYVAMDALENYMDNSSIDKKHYEFIKLRASQINGCAYCVNMHSRDLRKMGESEQRVWLVSAWREAGAIYSEEERLLFQITEEITLLSQEGLSDDAYEQGILKFGEQKLAEIIMAIVTINAWNRISVATHLKPAPDHH